MQPNLSKSLAIGAVAVVAAFGAWSLGKSSADTSSSSSAQPAGLQAPRQQGSRPGSGFGTAVTGSAAAKAEKAALAKYPGQVEVVVQLDDGSYIVHVITSGGEQHVAVSKDFKVTGAGPGGPGGPGGPPPAQNAPSGPTQTT
jgi:hypothetical protein